MFGVYLQEVAQGDNLTGRDDVSDDTIRLYLKAANTYFRFRENVLTPVFTQSNGLVQSDKMDPYLPKILASRWTWKRPAPKKEAISSPMLDAMLSMASEACLHSKHG
jgi:hypothetical protein